MCAEKPADVRDGTEGFALGGFTETLGGIQAAILEGQGPRSGRLSRRPAVRGNELRHLGFVLRSHLQAGCYVRRQRASV
jgi:hypothetical protein